MRVSFWNTCLRSGGCELPGVGLGTYFLSAHGGKIVLIEGYVGGTLGVISLEETYVSDMVQEYGMCDDKEPVEV